ncbi:MAG: alpha/beta fold hydrolase [Candidatus Tectimicrobiota bacterium]
MQFTGISKHLPLATVTLHYLDYGGTGPQTIVCIHGGGANVHWFDFLGPLLTPWCRVLAVDLRGHGDSSWAEPPDYTFETHLEDLRALFQTEGIHTPILLGHSMGGVLVTQYTGTWPQEVRALIVCDSRPVYSHETAETLQDTARRPGREYSSLAEYMAHYRIRPEGLRTSQDVHAYLARLAARQRPNGMWAHKIDRRVYAQRQPVNTLSFWQRITCPVLILRAEQSPRLTPVLLQQVAEVCPHMEWAEVRGAGHHLMLDQPEQTAQLIQAFLQRQQLL